MDLNNAVRVHPLAPVVALDIDGTLAAYHKHFHWFAQLYLQEPLDVDWRKGPEFSDALGLEKHIYRAIKLAYRQGGMKRSIPAIDSGIETLVRSLRENGLQVWITTTRPWERLDNIDPDTKFWIERQIGKVDGLLYGEDKYHDLIDIIGIERVVGIVDDLPENIERADSLGLNTLLRLGEHNRAWARSNPHVGTAHHSIDISNTVLQWRAAR